MRKFNERLSIRLAGESISPDSLSVSELAEIITAEEKALLAEIEKNSSDSSTDENPILSLVGIQEGSIRLDFHSYSPDFLTVFSSIAESIANQTFDRLSGKTRECLKTIQKVAKKHGMVVEFCTEQGTLATITTETLITTEETLYITGETALYGRVERIGGKTPKVWLRTSESELIVCEISESLAIELAGYLYQWVSVFGKAKWHISNYKIEAFEITGINKDYQDMPLNEAFAHLSQEIGHYYNDIDPIEYIKTIRDDD